MLCQPMGKTQQAFFIMMHRKDVKSVEEAIEEFGNPFQEESQDFFVLDSKVVADVSSATRMQKIECFFVLTLTSRNFLSSLPSV